MTDFLVAGLVVGVAVAVVVFWVLGVDEEVEVMNLKEGERWRWRVISFN